MPRARTPKGPVNARMAHNDGPKDESGTPFRVRDDEQAAGKEPPELEPGGSKEGRRKVRSHKDAT